MIQRVHGDPLALSDEYASSDKWVQLQISLRNDIADNKEMRDAQVEGDDLYRTYQDTITFMTRQLLALEANFDRLRNAQAAVTLAQKHRKDCHDEHTAFGTRCGKWRNGTGALGAVALILCFMIDDEPAFIILTAVLGLLAAAGLHALSVMGGGSRTAKADHADSEWRARDAELQYLHEQVMRGVLDPQPLSEHQPGFPHTATPAQQATVSLFPEQPAAPPTAAPNPEQAAPISQ